MKSDIVFPAFKFDSIENAGFNVRGYSLLKFGSVGYADAMGQELAFRFFAEHKTLILSEKLIVIPSPYNYVENAATLMTGFFFKYLNRLIYEVNGKPAEYTTIQRKVSYTADYGFLSKEDRKGLLNNDEFYMNREYMLGKTIVFVDDVKITGTHEDKLKELIQQVGLADRGHFFLYYAQYLGTRAEIESELNFSSEINAERLAYLLNAGSKLLIRPIKFIMSLDAQKFDDMINVHLEPQVVINLYDSCLAEGYQYIPKYVDNFQTLRNHLHLTRRI